MGAERRRCGRRRFTTATIEHDRQTGTDRIDMKNPANSTGVSIVVCDCALMSIASNLILPYTRYKLLKSNSNAVYRTYLD